MYDAEPAERRPRLAYLALGVFIAFAVYEMFGGENAATLMILALPIAVGVGLVAFAICALLRPLIR